MAPNMGPILDCVIVGGGPAGITAALYLARFRRRFLLVDAGDSRVMWIPTSHNTPGYAHGIHGPALLQRLRDQLAQYGAQPVTGVVERIEPLPDASGDLLRGFDVAAGKEHWQTRTVVLATGVVDVAPKLPELANAIAAGCVRYCPICDGYEAISKQVAVLGRGNGGTGEALFLRHYTEALTLLTVDEPITPTPEQQEKLRAAGIVIESEPVDQLQMDGTSMRVTLHDGSQRRFDVIYVALGTLVNGGMAQLLGAAATESGALIVDAHQQTTVDGLYAAGDVVEGLNQIAVAMGQAAIAATAIHNRLRNSE